MKKKKGVILEDTPRIKSLKHNARRSSIKEGIFSSIKTALVDSYVSPFAIALNASNSAVALLGSVGGLLGPLSQMFSSRLMEKTSRKNIVAKSIFIESFWILSFALLGFLFYFNVLDSILPVILILFFGIYVMIHNSAIPAWYSWMGDIVDSSYRGRWFSKRNLIVGFIAVLASIFAALFLDFANKNDLLIFGFIILFFMASLVRFKSYKIFKKQYEPKLFLKEGSDVPFSHFLLNITKDNFGKFTLYRSLIMFASSIVTPLVAVYLLRILKFDYTTYIIVILSATVFSLFVMELWGIFADRYGNYVTIVVTSALIPIIPILWIISPSPIYLVLAPSLVGGVSWAGFNLAAGNFFYDNVSKEKRGLFISYHNMLNGIGISLGAGLGAILIKIVNFSFIEPIFAIFLFSGILRIIIVIWWLPKLKEVRDTEKFDGRQAFKNIVFRELRPTLSQEAHQIVSIKKYFR